MDPAVDLAQAYLRVNGFFTVTEYPVLRRGRDGRWREATDVDVLAIRLPHAGRVLPAPVKGETKWDTDPLLDLHWGQEDLLIGEVKQGDAELNASWDASVLFEAVRRFGIAGRKEIRQVVKALRATGEARTEEGVRIRLVVFGSRPGEDRHPFLYVPLGHVIEYLEDYLRAHWRIQAGTRFRDPVLANMALIEKTRRG